MTENDSGAWKKTIYYPVLHASKYGRGNAIQPILKTSKHDTAKHEDVTDIESIAVYHEEKQEVTIFAVNRNTEEDVTFEGNLQAFSGYRVVEYLALENKNGSVVNSILGEKVSPYNKTEYEFIDGIFTTNMKSCSWNVIRLTK